MTSTLAIPRSRNDSLAVNDSPPYIVAGPCMLCGKTRSDALRPLLSEPALRIWSRIVMDMETAAELVKDA